MKSFVTANLSHHPGRTVASIFGVAIGIILVLLTVGFVRGALRERGLRETNTGIELLVYHKDQAGLTVTSLPMSLPLEWLDKVKNVPGVLSVTPVGQYLEMKGDSYLGLRQLDGVNFDSYTQATTVRVIDGAPLTQSGDVAIIDPKYADKYKLKPGDTMKLFDRSFKVLGIYYPETGSRVMIPLSTMQSELGVEGKCSMIMVKCNSPEEQEAIAQHIVNQYPDLRILFTRDLPKLFTNGYESFDLFLNIVVGLASVISLLVIMLTMYTAVTERTRQIGILKSLGASKKFIATVFVKESLCITLTGIVAGLLISIATQYILVSTTNTKMLFASDYAIYSSIGGLISGLIGAVYPALRAARQDPIDALSYE